jgi:hypothetical protein
MSAYQKRIGNIEVSWSSAGGWCRVNMNYNDSASEGFYLKSTEEMRDLHYVLGEAMREAEREEIRHEQGR